MAIPEFLKRLFAVRKAQTEGTLPPTFPSPPIQAYNGEAALAIDTVYACVSIISDTIAALPKQITNRNTQIDNSGSPINYLLNEKPNEYQTPMAFWSYIIHSILLTGNAYAIIDGAPSGLRLLPIPAADVIVRFVSAENGDYRKEYYVQKINAVLVDTQMLHFVGETLTPDGIKGISVIQKYAAYTLEHAQAVEAYSHKVFEKGTNLSGVIETGEMISAEEMGKLSVNLESFHQGWNAGGGILILDAGKHFNAVSLSPDDDKFIRSMQFSVERICRWFRVPLHLVQNGSQQSYNSNEANYGAWTKLTLTPLVKRIEQELNNKLLGSNESVEFCFDEMLRPSTTERTNNNIKACGKPYRTVNEIRRDEGYPSIEGGDVLFTPVNISNPSGLNNGGGTNTNGT